MARKTRTSTTVKDRWNKKHYEQIMIRVPIGAKEEIQKLAETSGLSVAEYIRQAIRQKAEKEGRNNDIPTLRGGVIEAYKKLLGF